MRILILTMISLVTLVSFGDAMALRNLDIGDPSPQFCGKPLEGKEICSSAFNDKVAVIAFIRTDQVQSKKVMLALQDLYEKFQDKDVSILAILSGNANLEELEDYRGYHELTFPVVLDRDREIYGKFGVYVYPSTIVLDRDNTLRYLYFTSMINYKKRVDGSIRYLLKEITKEEFNRILHPVIEETDPEIEKMQRYYNGAKKSFARKQQAKAKTLIKISLKKYPDHPPSLSLYGYILVEEKNCPLALEMFEKALQLDPDLEDAKKGKEICSENTPIR